MPDISNVPGAFDTANDPYAAYADGVIASLQEHVSGSKVIAAANKFHPRWDAMMDAGFGTYMQDLVNAPNEKEAVLVNEDHIQFIEECSPAYVKHLDNNALILYAHPDRTLWPLWASALDLLGIRPATT